MQYMSALTKLCQPARASFEAMLNELFNSVGPIGSIRESRDGVTRRPLWLRIRQLSRGCSCLTSPPHLELFGHQGACMPYHVELATPKLEKKGRCQSLSQEQ